MRVLKMEREPGDERTGVFTSGIVSTSQGGKIALYFTGRQHAGENLADVLKQRAAELPAPIQMCDALSRNAPKLAAGVEILLANCMAHGRRQFVDVAENFPEQCRYVLEMLGQVYGHDAKARERGMTPGERLLFHQEHSDPVMTELHGWLEAQIAERKAEPNSGLGKAIKHLLRHWRRLTLFLRVAGAPLDNNIVERVLKRAVPYRKNALFYRTLNGERVGDLFMSLIHTCQLCGAMGERSRQARRSGCHGTIARRWIAGAWDELPIHCGNARQTDDSGVESEEGFWSVTQTGENVAGGPAHPRLDAGSTNAAHADAGAAGVCRQARLDCRRRGEGSGLRCGSAGVAPTAARRRAAA